MGTKLIIKTLLRETLLDEDYPESFNMDKFKSLTTFKDRVNYCNEHLKRISGGTSTLLAPVR